jgi:type IV secretory pathway VirB6-like protein
LSAQLASAVAGLVVARVALAQLDRVQATPQGVAVAVLVAGFGIVVVGLARTGMVASCVYVLLGVAAAMGAACWVQVALGGRFGPEPWTSLQVLCSVGGAAAVGIGAVCLVRFAAELTRNTNGERSNHAFSALVGAAMAAGVVYAILALTS